MGLVERLRAGETLTGMQCFSASPVLVESMARAGLDFTIVDMEHCPTTTETLAHLVRAADAGGIEPLVRVPDVDAKLIGRCLDVGARGIVLPQASPARCAAALKAARYAPEGERGACPVVRSAGYLPEDWNAHAARANREAMVIPLVEDGAAVEAIDEILGLPGVDVVFLGPFDLAVSMGIGGADYRNPKLWSILESVVAVATVRGKFVMTTVGATIDEEYARRLLGAGVRLLSFSADVVVFLAACRKIASIKP